MRVPTRAREQPVLPEEAARIVFFSPGIIITTIIIVGTKMERVQEYGVDSQRLWAPQ
jgi:hypothetical protein